MADAPLYRKIVCGFEDNDRGEDALVLAQRVAERDGGELQVVHVEQGSPADALGALAERGEADLIVLGSTHRAALGSVSPGSVAEHLLKGALCRLIIAPTGYGSKDHSQDRLRVLAVGYDGMAESFGQRLSAFQGVQFQLTDAEVERGGVEVLAKYALWSVQAGLPEALDDALALRMAALEAAEVVFRVAHQVHGAIGFCDELPLSWLSRYSQPLRRLPLGLSATRAALASGLGRRGLTGLFSA